MTAMDGTLVRGVLDGDRAAFAELYDRRARLIRAICYDTTKDLHSAADLTQEVFFRAYRNLGDLRDPHRFGVWLVGIARQVSREWRRGRLKQRRLLMTLSDRAAGRQYEAPDRQIPKERKTVPSLTQKERLALHVYYLQERNVEEARTVLGLSRSGFYRVLSCARQRLARLLGKQEVVL